MLKRLFIIVVVLFLSISQCLSASIIIEDYTPQQTKTSLMKFFIKSGARIDNATDYSLTVKFYNTGFLHSFLFGSSFNAYPEIRTYYSFVQDGSNTILSASTSTVTNPNSSFEHATPLAERYAQASLNNLKKLFTGYYGYGFMYKKHKNFITITSVLPGSSASQKLYANTRIYKINHNPIKGMSLEAVESKLKAYDDKTKVTLSVKDTSKNIKDITIKSQFIKPVIAKDNL